MRAVIGLGNPEPRYHHHRHNVGWMVVDVLATRWRAAPAARRRQAEMAEADVAGERVLLVKPLTFMNESGATVRLLVERDGVQAADVVVVHDDLDLPLGRLRVRARGSAGGHRGLQSVLAALATREVPRVRVGIGRPPAGVDPVEYVLQDFAADEWTVIAPVIERAAAAVDCIVREGVAAAMDRYNAPPPVLTAGPEEPRQVTIDPQPELTETAP